MKENNKAMALRLHFLIHLVPCLLYYLNSKFCLIRHFQAAAKFKPTNYKHWLYAGLLIINIFSLNNMNSLFSFLATLMSEDTPLEAAKWLNDGLKIITNAKERSFMFTLKGYY